MQTRPFLLLVVVFLRCIDRPGPELEHQRGIRSSGQFKTTNLFAQGKLPAGIEVSRRQALQQLDVLDLFRTRREHDPRAGLGAPSCPVPSLAVRRVLRP